MAAAIGLRAVILVDRGDRDPAFLPQPFADFRFGAERQEDAPRLLSAQSGLDQGVDVERKARRRFLAAVRMADMVGTAAADLARDAAGEQAEPGPALIFETLAFGRVERDAGLPRREGWPVPRRRRGGRRTRRPCRRRAARRWRGRRGRRRRSGGRSARRPPRAAWRGPCRRARLRTADRSSTGQGPAASSPTSDGSVRSTERSVQPAAASASSATVRISPTARTWSLPISSAPSCSASRVEPVCGGRMRRTGPA